MSGKCEDAPRCEEVSIEVTHDCSLKCKFCSSSAEHPPKEGMEGLSLAEVVQVLNSAEAMDADTISISGGEPLIYEPIFDMLGEIQRRSFKSKLYTCGVIFGPGEERCHVPQEIWTKVSECLTTENATIILNLQGPDADTVDYLMDMDGTFDKLMQSIDLAVGAGFTCEAHMVPMKPNYQLARKVADLAEAKGFKKLSFLRFVPQGRGGENVDELLLSPAEFLQFQKTLKELLKETADGERSLQFRLGCPIDFQFLLDSDAAAQPCRGGTDAPLILPNGNVHMCPAWKELKDLAAGNIHDNSLKEIWLHSDFYKQFRQLIAVPGKLEGFCRDDCEYTDTCKGGCTAQRILAYGSDKPLSDCLYLSPDPLCPIANGLIE